MKLYRYESSKDIGSWTESLHRANNEYEDEKDYLMGDDPDEDETVRLVSIEIPDELIWEIEEGCQELRCASIMLDPDRKDEDPREDGYDFDFYAVWSDDFARRRKEESSNEV